MKKNLARANGKAATDIKAAISSFHAYCTCRNLSKRTVEYYDCCLLSFTRFIDSDYSGITLGDITPQVVRKYLAEQTQKNSASTACHCHTTLCSLYNYLLRDGYVSSSPMNDVEKPRRPKTIIETFTMTQVQNMLACCKNDFIGIRDQAMILVMVDCGLRVSELVGLCKEHLSWEEQTIKAFGKGGKERIVPYGNSCKAGLTRYIARRGDLTTDRLFVNCYGEPISRYSVREIIYRRGVQAGVTGVRCSPHTFRHTFAVMYLRNGGDAFSLQKLLGHTDLSMTRKYCELSQTDVNDKHRLYSPADRLDRPSQNKKRMR